jgi:hypothetical protein
MKIYLSYKNTYKYKYILLKHIINRKTKYVDFNFNLCINKRYLILKYYFRV